MRLLSELEPGQADYVCELAMTGGIRRRLLDLGLVPGTRVCCVLQSPCKDPTAFHFRGTVIALRQKDARRVLLSGA